MSTVRIAGDGGPDTDVWTCSCGLTRPVTGSYGCVDCGDGRPDSWDRIEQSAPLDVERLARAINGMNPSDLEAGAWGPIADQRELAERIAEGGQVSDANIFIGTVDPDVETAGPLPRYITVTPDEGAVITIAVPWWQIEAAVQAAGYEIVPRVPKGRKRRRVMKHGSAA